MLKAELFLIYIKCNIYTNKYIFHMLLDCNENIPTECKMLK